MQQINYTWFEPANSRQPTINYESVTNQHNSKFEKYFGSIEFDPYWSKVLQTFGAYVYAKT